MPRVAETVAEVRRIVADFEREALAAGATARVVLVPTMGALHKGHLGLVQRAREAGDIVVVSIFVNPLQFGANEDLGRYPRTLESDLEALEGLAQVVFAPSAAEMYPRGHSETVVTAGPVGSLFEGASRPGHFDGVLTVVAKLLNIVQPTVAVFGRKDAQQAFLVRRMVEDLNFPIRIEVGETVREADGLALSSRNRFLSPDERLSAVTLSAALAAGASAGHDGPRAAVEAASAAIRAQPDVRLDYLVVVDPDTFLPVETDASAAALHGSALLLVAAHVGATRLIDNERITFS